MTGGEAARSGQRSCRDKCVPKLQFGNEGGEGGEGGDELGLLGFAEEGLEEFGAELIAEGAGVEAVFDE